LSHQIAVVTGCAGFIGLNLAQKLLSDGWSVYGIDKLTHVSDLTELLNLKSIHGIKFKFVEEDIAKIKWLPECDVIFNLAAESDVDISNSGCKDFIKSNVEGVRNLLDIINSRIVIRVDKPLFFQFSTDEVYGDLENGNFDESNQLNPSNPYSATKASADLLIQSWSRTHGLDYIIVRPSNNYGLCQYPEKLIPLAVKRLQRNLPIKLHNEGKPIRTWTHVEDTIDAVMWLYQVSGYENIKNKVYNISSEYEQTNLETVTKIINQYFLGTTKRSIPNLEDYLDFSYDRPGQDVRYSISCKPLREIGWKPEKSFDDELPKLVEYYKKRDWIW